jgi:hypothetical protein
MNARTARLDGNSRWDSLPSEGDVSSFSDKHQAEQIAKRTAGVRRVTNMIQVNSLARRHD